MQAESVDLVYVSSYSSEYNHAMLVQFYLCLLFSDQAGLFSRGGYSSSVVLLGKRITDFLAHTFSWDKRFLPVS